MISCGIWNGQVIAPPVLVSKHCGLVNFSLREINDVFPFGAGGILDIPLRFTKLCETV